MGRYTKMELSQIVRKNIRKYRKLKKLTLQELADLSGLSHGYIRDLESFGIEKTPLLETLGKIANALEIDIRQLFDDIDEEWYIEKEVLICHNNLGRGFLCGKLVM